MTKKETQIQETFSQLNETTAARLELEKQARELKTLESQLKAQLGSLIPPNETRAGILHKTTEKPSVSYAKVYEAIVQKLVPKSRRPEADVIKENFTSVTLVDTYKAAE